MSRGRSDLVRSDAVEAGVIEDPWCSGKVILSAAREDWTHNVEQILYEL
jgi:hypothetical protein